MESRIFGNAAILIATQAITKLLGTIFAIAVARQLGVADYGLFAFAATLGVAFGLLAAFGLPRLITREVARKPTATAQVLGNLLILETVLSILAVLALIGTLVLLRYPTERLVIVAIVGASMVLNAVLGVITALFRAHQRMEWEALIRVCLSVLNLGMGLPILLAGFGLLGLSIVQLAVFSFVVMLAVILAMWKLARPVFTLSWETYRRLLNPALPFAASSFLVFVYDGMGILLVSFIKGDVITGLYSGAINFIRVFGLLPASLVGAFLPAMAYSWQTSRSDWSAKFRRSLKYLWIMALPISVGLVVLSDQFVSLLLGQEYIDSAAILRILAWMIPLEFLNHGFSNALISADGERSYLRIVGLTVATSLVVNLALIPIWGAYGAVVASLLAEGLVLVAQVSVLSRVGLRLSHAEDFIKPALSVTVMALGVRVINDFNLIVSILVGAAIYGATLFALRAFDADEIAAFNVWSTTLIVRLQRRLKRTPIRPS